MVWRNVCEHFLPWCFGRQWGSPEWNCIQTRSCLYLQHLLLPWLLPLCHARIYVDQLSSAWGTGGDYLVRWESSPLPRTDPLPNSLLKTELVLLLVFLHALPCHYGGHISKSQLLANDYSNDYKVTNGHEILSIVATSPMCVDQVLIENHSTLTQNMQNGPGNVFFRHSRVSAEHRGRTKPKLSESQSLWVGKALPCPMFLSWLSWSKGNLFLQQLDSANWAWWKKDCMTLWHSHFDHFVHGDVPNSSSWKGSYLTSTEQTFGEICQVSMTIMDHENRAPRDPTRRAKGEGFQAVSRAKVFAAETRSAIFLPGSLVGWL